MIEFRDNTFSDIFPVEDLTKRLEDLQFSLVKSIQIGTPNELQSFKTKNDSKPFTTEKSIETRLTEIESKIEDMKLLKSDILHIPSNDEIKKLGAP